MKKLIMALAALFLFTSDAAADIIIFTSGSAKEGIVQEETPTSVKMRVKNAVVGFSRRNIERIEYASPEENAKLDRKWKEQEETQKEERDRKREKKRRREKRQMDGSLVKVGGRWVTRKEKAELEQENLRRRIEVQKNEEAEAALAAEEEAEREKEEETEENPRAKDIAKIFLGKPRLVSVETDSGVLMVRVKNNGELAAESIFVEITLYNSKGRLISLEVEEMPDLPAGQSRRLQVGLIPDPRIVGETKVRVTRVIWSRF